MARWGNAPAGVMAEEERPQSLLSGLGQPGGILSGLGVQPGMPRVKNWLGERSAALMGFGLPLLLARTRREAAQLSMQGLQSGQQTDAYRNKTKADERRRAQQEQALATIMASLEAEGKIPAGMGAALAANPELGTAIAAQAFKPPERAGLVNAGGGQLYDPNSGTWITAPGGQQADPYTLNPGDIRFGPDNKPVASVPAAPNAGRAPVTEDFFDAEKGVVVKRQWNAETGKWEDVGLARPPSGMTMEVGPDGEVKVTQGPLGGRPTEAQTNANIYASRMESAEPTLQKFEMQGTSFWQRMAEQAGPLGNFVQSSDYQQFRQAKENFLTAVLRKESGAVISEEEMARGDTMYFPQPGDGEEVIKQKRENRRVAIEAIRGASRMPSTAVPTNDAGANSDLYEKYGLEPPGGG